MEKRFSGFSLILVLVVTLIVLTIGGVYYKRIQKSDAPFISPSSSPVVSYIYPTFTSLPKSNQMVNWKTYTNDKYKVEFKYPSNLIHFCKEHTSVKWSVVVGLSEKVPDPDCKIYVFASTLFKSIEEIIKDDADNDGGGASKSVDIETNGNEITFTTKEYTGATHISKYLVEQIEFEDKIKAYKITHSIQRPPEPKISSIHEIFFFIKGNNSYKVEGYDLSISKEGKLNLHPSLLQILTTFKFLD